jgi:hypothetical protein
VSPDRSDDPREHGRAGDGRRLRERLRRLRIGPSVPRFYFDSLDGNFVIQDDEGIEFDGLEAARDQAATALAEMAKDVLRGPTRRELAIEIRDQDRNPVLKASLIFEVQRLR